MSQTPVSSRYCAQCEKAQSACICQFIEQIDCAIPIIILQHPTETKKAIGTARLLALSLPQCAVFIGEDFSAHTKLNTLLANTHYQFSLIYPAEQATALTPVATNQKQGIILLDGTWRKAFKMYQLSTNLHKLPCRTLDIQATTQYRIRKSSKTGGLSTVEAGFHALSLLTGSEQPFLPLLRSFDALIDTKLRYMPKELVTTRYTK